MVYNMMQKLQPAKKTTSIVASVVAGAGLALTATTLPAEAWQFNFSGSDAGGTGSATMDFDGLGTSNVTVLLDNTSPLTLDDGTGVNSPGITFFGFDGLGDDDPGVLSWTLTAEDASGDSVVLSDWSLDAPGFRSGVTLDYLFTNDGNVKGALYNPDATSGLAAAPNYFTTATLEIEFDDAFTLDKTSTFVRMQNVGEDGEGSLKLPGTHKEVPEPSTLGALGLLAAAGMFGVGKQRKQM